MITKEAIDAAMDAYREGMYLTDDQVLASVTAILTAAFAAMPGPAVKVEYANRSTGGFTPAPDLASENERLRAALEFYSCQADNCDCVPGKENAESVWCGFRARKALEDRT